MKILTILGTRPEIIRLSIIIKRLDKILGSNHIVLNTKQNYDYNLNDVFFDDLKIRKPNISLETAKFNTLAEQLAFLLVGVEKHLLEIKPDKVLILGDTNTSLAATIICERHKIPVYHMEAGNRCFDLSVPEEINRKIIDNTASINMPYTTNSRENLLREGILSNKIVVTGNPIYEVLQYYSTLSTKNLYPNADRIFDGKIPQFVLVTAHRAENVDNSERFERITKLLEHVSKKYTVFFSVHPRTRKQHSWFEKQHENIILSEPLGFLDFLSLELHCQMAITDSGTVQEEMCIIGKPTITIRNSTERPETVWCGSNVVAGVDNLDNMILAYESAILLSDWIPPAEYTSSCVSQTVIHTLLSNF